MHIEPQRVAWKLLQIFLNISRPDIISLSYLTSAAAVYFLNKV